MLGLGLQLLSASAMTNDRNIWGKLKAEQHYHRSIVLYMKKVMQ